MTDAPIRVFVSYSKLDRDERVIVEEALKSLKEDGVAFWNDEGIPVSSTWNKVIEDAIAASDIALVLVSRPFLDTPYCRDVELTQFLELRRQRGLRVVPVILYDCDWQGHPWLGDIQAFPRKGKTLFGNYKGRAAREKILFELLKAMREVVADVRKTRAATPRKVEDSPPAEVIPPRPAEVPPTLDALFNRDPTIGRPAAKRLLEQGGVDVRAIVARAHELHPITVSPIRQLLAAQPAESGIYLAEVVRQAPTKWHAAANSTQLFHPAHRSFVASGLIDEIKRSDEVDFVRLAIESLGYMGATDGETAIIDAFAGAEDRHFGRTPDKYFFGKYHTYAIEALARMFVLTTNAVDARSFLWYVDRAWTLANRHGSYATLNATVFRILAFSKPHHADALIRDWVPHEAALNRSAAAHVLGQMRLGRAVKVLVPMLDDDAPEVVDQADLALGNIATPEACEALLARAPGSGWTMALPFVEDRDTVARIAWEMLPSATGNDRWRLLRAVGVRRLERFTADVRKDLHSADALYRGTAALALARLAGKRELPALERANEEAGDAIERTLTTLAVIVAGGSSRHSIDTLRDDLVQSHSYMRPICEDIVDVLSASNDAKLVALAEVWREVYGEFPDY